MGCDVGGTPGDGSVIGEDPAFALSPELAVTIVELAPDAILLTDHSGVISFANRQVEAVFGYAPDSLIGRPVEDLIPARFRTRHVEHRGGFADTPGSRAMGVGLELWGLRRDGTEVPVQVSLSPVNTADGLRTVVAVRDVSEHRADERTQRAGLVLAEEERIAAELHENVIDRLFQAGITIQGAMRLASEPLGERLAAAVDHLDTAIREIRRAVLAQQDQARRL